MTRDQIRQRLLKVEAAIEHLALKEGSLGDQGRSDWYALTDEAERLKAQLGDREAQARALTERTDTTTETGDGARACGAYRDRNIALGGADPAALLERAEDAGGTRTRAGGALLADAARSAISAWSERSDVPASFQESAERIVTSGDRHSRAVSEWIATASTPAYEAAFRTMLTGGVASLHGAESLEVRRVQQYLSERAMNEGTVAAGQAAVPPMLDPALIYTNVGKADSWRSVANVKTIATQTWRGVTSQGVSSHWSAEAAEYTDDSPSLTSPSISPVRLTSYIQASYEMVADTDLVAEIAGLFQDGRDRLEAAAFAVGTGSTQPTGLITSLDLTTASRLNCTTSGTVGLIDLYNADGALPPRFRGNASWMANKFWLNRIRQAVTSAVANQSPWLDFAGAMPSKAIGYPVYEASGMSTATASSTDVVVLGDFRAGYFIIDRTPSTIAVNNMVLGSSRRPTAEMGWALFSRVGADCVVPAAFQLLRL